MKQFIAVCLAIFTFASYASVTSYVNNEAGFLSAVSGETMSYENFNSFTSDSAYFGAGYSPLTVGDLTFSGTYSSTSRNFIDVAPYDSHSSFDIDGTPFLATHTDNTSASFTITFAAGVTAFSGDFQAYADARTSYITLDNQAGDTLNVYFESSSLNYVGFVSDTAFTSLVITSSDNDGFSMDNLSYTAVPEPATFSLMGIVGGIGVVIRRRFLV